ncbi:hypothetical protein G4D82_14035 [Flavobacterium sp. CYK-4]|uniref:GTP pyrophosphokinase n=1 Tax=Flavobacterium lotistagni TaxID=2709660 RepID=UPI001407E3EB|nr:hypothetical protein [Flavobacterium lotistagni]NHM08344.1 hypothetical protein [Flavobacterium lotistagni]
MSKLTSKEIEHEYSVLKSGFDKFNKSLLNQLSEILDNENIILGFPIQSRIKSIESILEKLESGRVNIKKSITELQDVIGLRIIILFKKDIDVLSNLISNNLEVVKQYNSEEKLLENQFGYSSKHFIVKIPKTWSNVPTFKGLEKFTAEIQIRTLSQHTWAEASNELQYKHEESVPRQLLRSIGRVSALLETVDLEFERLLIEREEYKSQITKQNTKDQTLNVDLLASILDLHLPKQNKIENEDYSDLLEDLQYFNIVTQKNLQSLIERQYKAALEEDKEYAIETELRNPKAKRKGYYYTHIGLIRTMMRFDDDKKWVRMINNLPKK